MKKETDYYKYHPKPRRKDTCKKVNCARYESYKKWDSQDGQIRFCIECKHASVSQFISKKKARENERFFMPIL